MNSRLATGLIFLGLGIVFMPRFTILALGLFIVGAVKLVSCFKRQKHLRYTFDADLRCRVPREAAIRRKVQKLNRLYNRSKGRYPELAGHYKAIIDSLWHELSDLSSEQDWHDALDQVLRDWPMPFRDASSAVSESLARARIAADAWRQAHQDEGLGKVL